MLMGIRGLFFKVIDFIGMVNLCQTLMTQLKRSWQYRHSCCAEFVKTPIIGNVQSFGYNEHLITRSSFSFASFYQNTTLHV